MKEQMNVIADVLENNRQEWACLFHMKKHIWEHTYDIDIERKANRLELTAKLPVTVDADKRYAWIDKVRRANEDVECGRFSLNVDGRAIYYRVYSLYTSDGEVKDAEAVKALLDCCDKALEAQGEAILAQKKRRSLLERFWDLVEITDNTDSEVCE
ncbi:MAG: hypothetical protein IJG07_10575 [Prevotella sp.]|nr:hypothetical protein [Prevotella sp.]